MFRSRFVSNPNSWSQLWPINRLNKTLSFSKITPFFGITYFKVSSVAWIPLDWMFRSRFVSNPNSWSQLWPINRLNKTLSFSKITPFFGITYFKVSSVAWIKLYRMSSSWFISYSNCWSKLRPINRLNKTLSFSKITPFFGITYFKVSSVTWIKLYRMSSSWFISHSNCWSKLRTINRLKICL